MLIHCKPFPIFNYSDISILPILLTAAISWHHFGPSYLFQTHAVFVCAWLIWFFCLPADLDTHGRAATILPTDWSWLTVSAQHYVVCINVVTFLFAQISNFFTMLEGAHYHTRRGERDKESWPWDFEWQRTIWGHIRSGVTAIRTTASCRLSTKWPVYLRFEPLTHSVADAQSIWLPPVLFTISSTRLAEAVKTSRIYTSEHAAASRRPTAERVFSLDISMDVGRAFV